MAGEKTTQAAQATEPSEADNQARAMFEQEVLALEAAERGEPPAGATGAAGAAVAAAAASAEGGAASRQEAASAADQGAGKAGADAAGGGAQGAQAAAGDGGPRIAAKPELGQLTAEEIEALRNLPNALKTIGGRVSKMQGDLEKMGQQAAATTTGEGGAAPTKDQIKAAGADLAKWNKLKTDFPEWGEAFEERLAAMAPAQTAAVDTEKLVAQARDEALATARAEREAERESEIAEEYPDWKDRLQQQGFVDWFNAQPGDYRTRKWNSRSPTAIVGMLRDHERAVSQQQQQGGQSVDQAQQSRGQSSASAPAHAAATSTAPAVNLAAAVTKRGGTALPRVSEGDLEGKALWDHLTARETATK